MARTLIMLNDNVGKPLEEVLYLCSVYNQQEVYHRPSSVTNTPGPGLSPAHAYNVWLQLLLQLLRSTIATLRQ